jgi:excisionase family DNA binding protein
MTTLIRPGDLAKDLAVSRTWVYEAANSGRIPSIRIGGEQGPLRFVPEDVDRWLEEARKAWSPGGPSIATRNPSEDRQSGEQGRPISSPTAPRERTQSGRGQRRDPALGRSSRR